MTKKNDQMTTDSGQDAAALHAQLNALAAELAKVTQERDNLVAVNQAMAELGKELSTLDEAVDRLESIDRLALELKCRTEERDQARRDMDTAVQAAVEARALALAASRVLGLDDNIDDLPQKAADLLTERIAVSQYWYEKYQALEVLRTEVERLRVELEQAQDAIRWLWGFWDGNMLVASPGADREALDEAWDKLLRVLK